MASDSDTDEEILVLATATAVAVQAACQQKIRDQRKVGFRQWYIHPKNASRPQESFYRQCVLELDKFDEKSYFDIFRMGKSAFEDLLKLTRDQLTHAPNHRYPISPAERLAMTLK